MRFCSRIFFLVALPTRLLSLSTIAITLAGFCTACLSAAMPPPPPALPAAAAPQCVDVVRPRLLLLSHHNCASCCSLPLPEQEVNCCSERTAARCATDQMAFLEPAAYTI